MNPVEAQVNPVEAQVNPVEAQVNPVEDSLDVTLGTCFDWEAHGELRSRFP